uniref:Putative ovule protein n=1 Tax=Solanum chacoense TaxID=4108 RepID=A0A0V0GFP3_SOLCH
MYAYLHLFRETSSAGESDYVLALGLLLCFSSKADGVVHWWLEKSSKILIVNSFFFLFSLVLCWFTLWINY